MNFWNEIYSHFSPVALQIFGFSLHWYGIFYAFSLFLAIFTAFIFIKKFPKFFPLDPKIFESYVLWIEVGVILGARIGYILFYDPRTLYFLTHPWQIFNPFDSSGEFIGISGMSYHGALIGIFIANFFFCRAKNLNPKMTLDLIAISAPLAYIFGRIGNFLNQELIGRPVDPEFASIGILVRGNLVYPSQLFEAFLEGACVFFVLFFVFWHIKNLKNPHGILVLFYGFSYAIARFFAEFFRAPDPQIGLIFSLTLGQILCIFMAIFFGIFLFFFAKSRADPK